MAVRFLLLLLDAAYFDLPDASGELRLRVRHGGFSQDWAVVFLYPVGHKIGHS
jgi:hypothetical protein